MNSYIAIVSQSAQVTLDELLQVSAALQKQILRDFAPLWGIPATVDAFARLADVPVGYWPVIVVDEVFTGDLGVHGLRDHQPLALIKAVTDWSLTASHEVLEMIADPFGNRLVAGDSLSGDGRRVEYLVEVCDPCQDRAFGYYVNGYLVSNFYTPNYFDATGSSGARYDFVGGIGTPRQVLEGGYLTWRDPETNHLHKADCIGGELWWTDFGPVPDVLPTLRSLVDANPPVKARQRLHIRRPRRSTTLQRPARLSHQTASAAKANRATAQLASLSSARRQSA